MVVAFVIPIISLWTALLLAFLFRGSFTLMKASIELLALLFRVKQHTAKVRKLSKAGGGGWSVVRTKQPPPRLLLLLVTHLSD